MDSQRPFLYLTLFFLLFLTWSAWNHDHAPKPPTPVTNVAGTTNNGDIPAGVPNQMGSVTENSGASDIITVRTDKLLLHISTRGGTILEADLPSYPVSVDQPDQPVRILDLNNRNYIAQSGLLHQDIQGQDTKGLAPDSEAVYSIAQKEYTLAEGQNELIVPLTWQGTNGVTVTKNFVFKRGSFLVQVNHEVQNNSANLWSGTEYRQLKHGAVQSSGGLFSGVQAYVGGAYYHDNKYKKVPLPELEKTAVNETVTGGWVAMQEHYFLSAWVPPQNQQGQYYSRVAQNQGAKGYILGISSPIMQIAPGAKGSFNSEFYVGPKDQDTLSNIAQGLDLTVDYGMFAFISKPIFWLMQLIHTVVGNWGWTIIFLTIIIKAVFFYPSAVSYKSMAKMKSVAPKMKDINERYASDPQGKQQAMMELYRKEKINPLGGCLPILIQIPVFMGLYWVLLESVELRQAPWILWYKDLSIKDPFYVLPVIYGISMYIQQKLNPPQVDPMQQKIFQFMPVALTVMFLFFPAGLVLYWVVNNALSMAQQWYINKKVIGHA